MELGCYLGSEFWRDTVDITRFSGVGLEVSLVGVWSPGRGRSMGFGQHCVVSPMLRFFCGLIY